MKMTIDSLSNISLPRLRFRSLDLSLYTAEVLLQGEWQMLCDEHGKVLSWRSLERARRDLSGLHVRQASLLHMSAYHEMIGLEPEQLDPLEVPLSWPVEG